MANENQIVLTIDVDAMKLMKAEAAAKKTTKAVDKTAKSTENLGHKTGGARRQLHGMAGMTSNSTKQFSKMQQGMGKGSSGLVGAYATLAANVFAATAAFTALRSAAQTAQLVQGLEAVGEASGRNLGALAQRIREAADGALSLDQALRTAATGASANFSDAQLLGLTKVAKGAALALGRDVGDAQDRLVRGAAKLEPEILDELGIFVRLDDAAEKYAASIGKTASELTRFQKGQAFTNEIITQGSEKFSEIADAVDPNPYDRLAASLTDLSKKFMNLVNSVLGPFVDLLANNQLLLAGFFAIITKGVIKAALPALSTMGGKMAELGMKIQQTAEAEVRANERAQKAIVEKTRTLGTGFKNYDRVIEKMKREKVSVDEIKAAQRDLHEYIKKNQNSQKGFIQARVKAAKEESQQLDNLLAKRKQLGSQSLEARLGGRAGADFETKGASILSGLDEPGGGGFENYKKAMADARAEGKKYSKRMNRIAKNKRTTATATTFLGRRIQGIIKPLKRAKVGFTSFGLSAKVAVKGIFTAIPVIGQFLFAIDLVLVALKKLFKFVGGLIPESSKLAKSMQATNSAIKNVATSTREANMAGKTQSEQITISGTSVRELVSAYELQVAAQEKVNEKLGIMAGLFEAIKEKGRDFVGFITRAFKNLLDQLMRFFAAIQTKVAEFMSVTLGMRQTLAGAMNTLSGAEEGNVDYINVDAMEKDTNQALKIAREYQEQLAAQRAKRLDSVVGLNFDSSAMTGLRGIEEILMGTGEASEELSDALGTGAGGVNDFVAAIKEEGSVFGALTQSFVDQIEKQEKLEKGSLSLMTNSQILAKIMKVGTSETMAMADAVGALGQITQNEGIKIDKFMAAGRMRGSSASIADVFNDINKAVTELDEKKGITAVAEQYMGLSENTKKLVEGLGVDDFFEGHKKSFEEASREIKKYAVGTDEFNKQQGIMDMAAKNMNSTIQDNILSFTELTARMAEAEIKNKTLIATNERLKKSLKLAGDDTIVGMKKRIDLTNESYKIEKTAIDDEITAQKARMGFLSDEYKARSDAKELTAEDKQNLATLLQMEEKRSVIMAKEITDAHKLALLQKAKLKDKGLENKLAEERAQTEEKMFKIQQRLLNISKGQGGALNARQQFEIEQRAAEIKIKTAKQDLKLTEAKFNIEMAILDAKMTADGTALETRQGILNDLKKTFNIEKSISQEKIRQMETDKSYAGLDFGGGVGNMTGAAGEDLNTVRDAMFKGDQNASIIQAIIDDKVTAAKNLNKAFDEARLEMLDSGTNSEDLAQFDALREQGLEAIGGISEEQSAVFQTRVSAMNEAVQPMLKSLRELGPEGELAGAVFEGGIQMASAFEIMANSSNTAADRFAAAAAAIQSISSIMAASGKQAIAAIDQQIEAEKKRDGKSAESVNKIKALESKKDAIARKNFERTKKMQIAGAIASTAAAVAGVLGEEGKRMGFFASIPAMLIGAMGLAQVAIIRKQQYQGASGDASTPTPPSITVGKRSNRVDVSKSAGAGEMSYLMGQRGIGTNANNFQAQGGAAGLRKGYADGGNVLVGERGPEMIRPLDSMQVVPNDAMGGKQVAAHFTINAIDSQGVEEVLQAQQGNIISMIRSAANDYGQEFLESVETDHLIGGSPKSAGGIDY